MEQSDIEKQIEKVELIIKEKNVTTNYASKEIDKLLEGLENIYQSHIKELLPIMDNKMLYINAGKDDLKKESDDAQKVLALGQDIYRMVLENAKLTDNGLPPKYSTEQIEKTNEQISHVRKNNKTENAKPAMITIFETISAILFLRKYYQEPLTTVLESRGLNSSLKLKFTLLQGTLYITAVFIAYGISQIIKSIWHIEGFIVEIGVALFCLFTIDRLFKWIKIGTFWKIATKLHNKHKEAFIQLNSVRDNFNRIKGIV